MCMASQPKPDINKPNYTPDQMDQNFKLTVKDGNGIRSIDQTPQDKKGTAVVDGPVVTQSGGIHMR